MIIVELKYKVNITNQDTPSSRVRNISFKPSQSKFRYTGASKVNI
jgi:hypothetical protein